MWKLDGGTHIQKAAYLLQELLGVPSGFKFVLYKHGPFSFELRDSLNRLEAWGGIQTEEQPYPYGPKIIDGPLSGRLNFSVLSELARLPAVLVPDLAPRGCD